MKILAQVDSHTFNYLARSTGNNVLNRLKDMVRLKKIHLVPVDELSKGTFSNHQVIDVAWTIEARENEEMPERVLSCFRMYNIDLPTSHEYKIPEHSPILDDTN